MGLVYFACWSLIVFSLLYIAVCYHLRWIKISSVATVAWGTRAPKPQSGRVTGTAEILGEKNGGGIGGYRIILAKLLLYWTCILVTKYISKLNKIQNTNCMQCLNHVFQMLVFQLHDNSPNKHAEQPRFFLMLYPRPIVPPTSKSWLRHW